MVTRLQSPKGSFVQSPKKAFDGEAPPLVRVGIVNNVTRNAIASAYPDPTNNCFFNADSYNSPPGRGYTSTELNFDAPFPDASDIIGNYVVGLTSGSVLNLTALVLVCGAITYGDNSATTGNGFTAYANSMRFDDGTQFAQTILNWGLFGLSEQTFIVSEPFALSATPP